MNISKPTLPPKEGYVEVINEQGEHVYQPTAETLAKMAQEQLVQTIQEVVATMLGIPDITETQAAIEFRKAVQISITTIEDESTMMEIASVYPEYHVGVAYKTKDIFQWGKNSVGDPQLYQVLQDHISASEWTPDTATSLYKKIGISEDGTPIWVQPLGATDAYNIGDRVMYNGKKYESVINANVWSPDAYPAGWKLVEEVTEPTPEPEPSEPDPEEPTVEPEEPTDVPPDFVQPTGAHDAYHTDDRVTFEGKIYESLIDSNVWSPSAYPAGWKVVE